MTLLRILQPQLSELVHRVNERDRKPIFCAISFAVSSSALLRRVMTIVGRLALIAYLAQN